MPTYPRPRLQLVRSLPRSLNEKILLPVPTAEGRFIAAYSSRGLVRLEFPPNRPGRFPEPTSAARRNRLPATMRRRVAGWHRQTTRALRRVLNGKSPGTLPPLDLSRGTAFQRRVWAALRQIPPGQTRTYGEIARQIGRPRAARAVGDACGANPIPVLIPCHRVLAVGGRLGGFSGGLDWKRRLLTREGIPVVG